MISLFERFNNDLPKLSYYDIPIIPDDLFSCAADNSRRGCKSFIDMHFLKGSKESVLDVEFRRQYEANGKHEHTVALYLLGSLFKDEFFPEIRRNLCELEINNTGWYNEHDFLYTWYLTCLYHDVASCVEDLDGQTFPCCDRCPFKNRRSYSSSRTLVTRRFSRFSESTIKSYCHYRIFSGKLDHGIYGGMLLFDKLAKNFLNKTQGHPWEIQPELQSEGLSWRLEHLNHFAYAAAAIVCHNMWTVQTQDTESVEMYRAYHLDELIIQSDDDKLSLKNYPLQFMLCLLDTIEPVKRFGELMVREVLENVSIEPVGGNKVKIAWTDTIKQQPEFLTWMKNISDIKNWMLVNVSDCKQEGEWYYVTIDFR